MSELTDVVLTVRLMGVPAGSGQYSEWLKVIHEINRDYKANSGNGPLIGEPLAMHDWWAGGWCEEYPDFRVVLVDEQTNYVSAKTQEAAEYLRRAYVKVVGMEPVEVTA